MAHQRSPRPRRAAVSSYGLSGTNVHAIVEQAPETTAPCATQPAESPPSTAPLLFPAVVHFGRRTAAHRRRLADWVDAHAPDLAPPDLAYTLARRRAHRPVRTAVIAGSLDGADRGFARGRRRRYSVSGRGRAGRSGTGVGVLRAGFAVGGDGRRAARDRTGVRRDRRRGRAADRPGVRVLGDRGDVGARDGDRHRPGPADAVRHAGRAGRHDEGIRGAAGRGHRALAGRGRGRGRRGRAVAGRRGARDLPPLAADVHASPVPARWRRWNCLPSKCFRN